ncbi:chromosome segregation protein SMC [Streptococcus sciuri]|uniref:Chromosome partition protein Smc n=1 Tax=Streptococcus sciuri TaxID=2973939 RepID=A0ABT2F7D3_9STRE|nr:chromosome segregation protein SMC [Streptococcus sciuri]MCS4488344.1 chromosome segregation protein SMC [Streptococcus sciuri]
MFLKEIELQGFKSFADKTIIAFDKGVTAIVGPNGSGKSNITESLRWALGESSAKSLRGGKMPDVIFAGTQSRKPLNYAYVAVTLDNSDQFIKHLDNRIRVERRIFRNGDSEYLIDGRKVRLRDVNELFMDTGLGRDSFSVISQGRVEEIFNNKPQDRRAIFEEAAGVLKYKTRKKETQTKLDKTQNNLERLEDIIYELETQVTPLKHQADTAKRFLALDDERKVLDLAILVEDIEARKAILNTQKEELAVVKDSLSVYYDTRQKLEVKIQKLKDRRRSLTDKNLSKQKELLNVTQLVADLEHQIEVTKLAVKQSTQKTTQLTEQAKKIEENIEQIESELNDKTATLTRLKEKFEQEKANIARLETDLEQYRHNPDKLIEQLREQFVVLLQKEAELSNQKTALEAQKESQEQQFAFRKEEMQQLAQEISKLKEEETRQQAALESASQSVKDLLEQYQEKVKLFKNVETTYQERQDDFFQQMDKIKSKRAKKASLESIYKNHSHFYAGVKAVLQEKNLVGIIGAVSEHLSFSPRYQIALEVALGASSQHIIVEDEEAAKQAIAFLKQYRKGRATFLPLTTISSRQLASQQLEVLETSRGFLGVASQLMSYDRKLSHIMSYLLGLTAIFDTIEHANQAAKRLSYRVRIVTLDGTEIRTGGSFSGGASRGNNTTFIKQELDQISQELKSLENYQITCEQEVAMLKTKLESERSELAVIKEDGNQKRLDEQAISLSYHQLKERLADVEDTYQTLKNHDEKEHKTSFDALCQEIDAQLKQLAQEKITLSRQIEQLKTDKDSFEADAARLSEQLSQAKLQERELVSEIKFEKANQDRLQMDQKTYQTELSSLTRTLTHQKQLDDTLLPRLKKQLDQAKDRKSSLEQEQISVRFELEDIEAQVDETNQLLAQKSQQNEQYIRQQAQIEAQIETAKKHLRQFAYRLSEEYQYTLEDAKKEAHKLDNLAIAREQLRQLIHQIKNLGPVNLDAIEQFEEVSQRLNFLNTQKKDLVDAKNLLLTTISDMDAEVKQRFKLTFEAIRESFKQTFTQMFGGGNADLTLTSEDFLETGIEISVQPPGKKIQSLNLMSGGEKALSALALLFAIIRVKTIPFVILDEVEAALDEANVKRFGDYLNHFDQSSQFIVVTHRKGTMAAANSIYGVTMQESGISRIVSVKLKDAEELTTT